MSKETIRQILKRLNRIEQTIFPKIESRPTKEVLTLKKKSGLPYSILQLREQKFFKQPKISSEVHKKLQPTYHCDLNRVEVALLRLNKKKQLRKSLKLIGDKKIIAYVW